MGAQTNLQLYDGQATPVLKTFTARGADMGLARYLDISSGIGIGLPSVTLGNKMGSGPSGVFRVEGRITIPVLEVISGDAGGYTAVPKVAFNMFGKVELIAPNRASAQNRKDLRAFMANFLDHATLMSAFIDFDPPN